MEAEQEPVYDARFEFDAPRYYDFETMSCGTPADKWFETAPDGPGCKPDKAAGTSREPFKELQDNTSNKQQEKQQQQQQQDEGVTKPHKHTPAAAASAAAAAASPAAAAAAAGAEAPKAGDVAKPNIVTSWGQTTSGRKSAAAAGRAAGPTIGTKRPASGSAVPGREARRVCDGVGSGDTSSSGDHAARSEPPVTRSMARLGATLFSPVPEHRAKHGSPPATRARPATGQRFYTVQKGKGTTARTKQPASEQKLRHVLLPKVTKPARSTKPLTLPDDFELQTSKRGGGRAAAAAAAAAPQDKSPFKPLAEKVREFQYKTPQRFKPRPSKATAAGAAISRKRSPITKAEAPQLLTSLRSRSKAVKSQQELEEEEVERMRREQFKAKPLDTRVLSSSGQLGVPKVDKPRPTEPRPFNLRSDSRAKLRRSHEQPSMQAAAAAAGGGGGGRFRAQPLNRSILDGPTFKPQRDKPGTTKPVSPELMTKKRALVGGSAEQEHRLLARSQAGQGHAGHGAGPSSSGGAGKPTQPQPFHLATEARGAQHQQEMAAKLAAEEARAKRLRRVTARPLPVTVDVPVVPPKPDAKPLTLPDPFELKSMARHEEYEQQHRQQLEQEREAARRAAEFKARPVATAGPFVVHESEAPLTVPHEPHLTTDARAAERAEFDAHMAEKMRREEEERRQQEELRRQQEEEAVREYRRKLRFSARPMPNFHKEAFFAQPSDKPLTNPKTPKFASKKLRRGG